MAGSEKITERIFSEAKAQAQEITEAARQQAEAAKERAVSDANAMANQILEKARQDAEEGKSRAMAVADLTLRKELLSQKHNVVNEAFAKAKEAFSALSDEEFASAYVKLVLEAVQKGEEGIAPSVVDAHRLGEGFVKRINEALQSKGLPHSVKLLPAREDVKGGCVVISGDMEIDFSVDSVLQTVRERCEGEVAAKLFAFMEG